jgi:hypothetical protein
MSRRARAKATDARATLRASELGAAYEDAWQEWFESGDAEAWDAIVDDGLTSCSQPRAP